MSVIRKVASAGAVGAIAATSIFFSTASSFGLGETHRGVNSPSGCVTIDSNGNVVAPGPGDCAQFGKEGQGRTSDKARNVILIIGDGMGQSEITAARNYLKGAGGRFEGIDELTSEGMYTHHSINPDGSINYVTDSAASGTAWSTGTKTYNGALGVDILGNPVENLIEKAKNAGMRTGNVTTSDIQDATPGAMGSHVTARSHYAPSGDSKPAKGETLRENGGLGSISEQLVDTRADVTMGGGAKWFDALVTADSGNTNPFLQGDAKFDTKWTSGKSVVDNAKDNGFQVVTNASELSAVNEANQESPILGLFSPSNMTTRFASTTATVGGGKADPVECQIQDTGDEPDLKLMTDKAIELLDDPTSDKGFFLQVESASIDKRDHAADACGQIGETERLDEATKAALDFAKKEGNTLVVVTADHSHTSQIVSDNSDSVALVTRLKTADGSPMSLAYGTSPADGSQQHTGAQLRVAAYGPGEENVIGQTDQTDLHYTIANALGIGDAAPADNGWAPLANPAAAQPVTAADGGSCYKLDANGKFVAPEPGECAQYGKTGEQRSNELAQNVILFIGDGMGDSEITSARNYLYGANGRLPGVDSMDYTGSYTHYSINKDGTTNYVTDSAASGTAWATGAKSYNGAIGVDAAGKPVENLIELAKKAGMKTGNVSTAEIQDATPAVMGAHAINRKCYGPQMDKNSSSCQGEAVTGQYRENGGIGSISEQLVDTRADVTLGGGSKAFDQIVRADSGNTNPFLGDAKYDTKWTKGTSVLQNAEANGFQIVKNSKELSDVTKADQDQPLLGLFTSGNMPRHFLETVPTADGADLDAKKCELNPDRTADVPSLAAMTGKAIELLDNENGFFLQVEGASIDKADHGADICGQIGELDDLDEAMQVAQNWVAKSGQPTLVIVTADHAHTSQITGGNTLGLTTKLLTADGDAMNVSYQTASSNAPEVALGGQGHTGAQLRIAASGPSAENVVGRTDQTDLHYTVYNALDLSKSRAKADVKPSEPANTPSPSAAQETPGATTPGKKVAKKLLPRTGSDLLPVAGLVVLAVAAAGGVAAYKRRK